MDYKEKYLKYKSKYLSSRNQSRLTPHKRRLQEVGHLSYPLHLSPEFSNNNNINLPTTREINTHFPNFRRMREGQAFSTFAETVISRYTPFILYVFEEVEQIDDPNGWIWANTIINYTLHIIYYTIEDHLLHHKMFNYQTDGRMGDRLNTWDLYREIPVENFDYDTLRLFKLPPLEHQPAPI